MKSKPKIYIVDVPFKAGQDYQTSQMATGKQLNDIGLTCKQWATASDSVHRWRVWVYDDNGECFTYLTLKFSRVIEVDLDLRPPSWCKNASTLSVPG